MSILSLLWTRYKVKGTKQALLLFEAQQIRRGDQEQLRAEIWNPPVEFHCVTGDTRDGDNGRILLTCTYDIMSF